MGEGLRQATLCPSKDTSNPGKRPKGQLKDKTLGSLSLQIRKSQPKEHNPKTIKKTSKPRIAKKSQEKFLESGNLSRHGKKDNKGKEKPKVLGKERRHGK